MRKFSWSMVEAALWSPVPLQILVAVLLSFVATCRMNEHHAANDRPQTDILASDAQVDPGTPITLDGTGSSDPDGDTLSYLWSLRSRPVCSTATILNAASATAILTPDVPGDYVVLLTVSDGKLTDDQTTTLGANPIVLAQSTFDVDSDGWTVFADGTGPSWKASGGNPGGYISVVDKMQSQTWYFLAPTKYLSAPCRAYGGRLLFDLKQAPTTNQYNGSDVVLIGTSGGGDLTLVFDASPNPLTTWTSYEVALESGSGWHKSDLAGDQPTASEFLDVLATLTALRIRGEFQSGADTGDLDNVVLWSGTGK